MKNKKIFYILITILVLIILFALFYFRKQVKEGMQTKYTAIIVEPREHKALQFVLENFYENLDDNWEFVILHGNKNKNYLESLFNKELKDNKSRTMLHNLNIDNLSIEEYNELLTSPSFYSYIKTETFLIFQTDSMICGDYKNNINEFLNYDYVGAPNKEWVGNGGLSLRKKSKMLDVINKFKRKDTQHEDQYFTEKEHQLYIPNITTANRFSNEGIYSDESFGVHKPWWYLNEDELNKKEKKCKGLKKLIELNK